MDIFDLLIFLPSLPTHFLFNMVLILHFQFDHRLILRKKLHLHLYDDIIFTTEPCYILTLHPFLQFSCHTMANWKTVIYFLTLQLMSSMLPHIFNHFAHASSSFSLPNTFF